MAPYGGTMSDQISRFVEPVLVHLGFELVDVEYLAGKGRAVLRIYMDRPGGVTLDDCAKISREIGVLMDVKDLIPKRYVLEVSSPGLDRRLKREKDFVWATGKKVQIRMKQAVGGHRNFSGLLTGMKDGMIVVAVHNGEAMLPIQDIEKAKLVYE